MKTQALSELIELVGESIQADETSVKVTNPELFRQKVEQLVLVSALSGGTKAGIARYLVRGAALELGVIPSSIHELYIGRGKGDIPNTFTVPAINLRVLTFDAARAVFRSAQKINASAMIFEIARSEIGYTEQRPSEYTTYILGAAIAEDFSGPVFIQGDHFQVSPARYFADANAEIQAVKDLTIEAIHAGFYNIDVDTSTLVDLDKETIPEQQALNSNLSAELSAFIRGIEPEGVTVSIGGEIGEVGGHNSTETELRAYTNGYNRKLAQLGKNLVGLSKISIQTGTSHGGVVLPDGTIATVSVDFETLYNLSKIARDDYHMGGAVQHGASTLPQEAFGKFVEAQAVEVHLATNFQNIFFEQAPKSLVAKMYAYLDENAQNERKPDMTDDQFYYKSRKRAMGAFKSEALKLSSEDRAPITKAWEAQFAQLFDALSIADTREFVEETITPVKHLPPMSSFIALLSDSQESEDTSDLAD